MLGIAVSPIWVIMLSSVEEAQRGKQMGYVCLVIRVTRRMGIYECSS